MGYSTNAFYTEEVEGQKCHQKPWDVYAVGVHQIFLEKLVPKFLEKLVLSW